LKEQNCLPPQIYSGTNKLNPFRAILASTMPRKSSVMKSEENCRSMPELQYFERVRQASTETGDKFTHRAIISSIGVLQITEKHNNGKATSRASIIAS
jgi:hypothetical protein